MEGYHIAKTFQLLPDFIFKKVLFLAGDEFNLNRFAGVQFASASREYQTWFGAIVSTYPSSTHMVYRDISLNFEVPLRKHDPYSEGGEGFYSLFSVEEDSIYI